MNKHEQRETLNKWHERQRRQRRQRRESEGGERDAAGCCRARAHHQQSKTGLTRRKEGTKESGNVDCVRVMNMIFLAARSAGCARTTDTGHRIVQRRGRWIETRGTENRRGEGG